MARITVIGTGYVGLVSGACLADFGNTVVCVDVDQRKIDMLNVGQIPIYEPGLADVVSRNVKAGRLSFTMDVASAVKASEVVFIAVGTPPADDGSADLSYILEAAESIAKAMTSYLVVVDKSTVPVGTARLVHRRIVDTLAQRGQSILFDVVSNPEFLREGTAVYDFMHPDRVVIGTDSERALSIMKDVYRALYLNETPFIETNPETAEMIKYAANAFLAVKITFINEIANLCEKVGANVLDVARAMGKDGRISPKFLHPGPGYGGSCFPKDTKALADIGKKYGSSLSVVEATIEANERQKEKMVEKIESAVGNLQGTIIALLGLAFKPNTDDMREAPALKIIEGLVKKGARCRVYDPAAMEEAKWRLQAYRESLEFCGNEYEAMTGSDALVIVTEWNQFRDFDLNNVKSLLKRPIFIDMRNIYRKKAIESAGMSYYGVGQGL
jgi:UDPglucose 6-dehydrogenase